MIGLDGTRAGSDWDSLQTYEATGHAKWNSLTSFMMIGFRSVSVVKKEQ